jgi:hypothetical protein
MAAAAVFEADAGREYDQIDAVERGNVWNRHLNLVPSMLQHHGWLR